MPFDDFVGLENLTARSPYIYGKKGFLANYPQHGSNYNIDDEYLEVIRPIQDDLTLLKDELDATKVNISNQVSSLMECLTLVYLYSEALHLSIQSGSILADYLYDEENDISYYDALYNAFHNGNRELVDELLQSYSKKLNASAAQIAYIGQQDVNNFLKAINDYQAITLSRATNAYEVNRNAKISELNAAIDNYLNTANYNHLWSWVNDPKNPVPLVETKLGIQLSIETLLGDFRPMQGKYGVKILINGMRKGTETEPATQITDEVIWDNSDMYGNTYAFTVPYNQQRIFDISEFLTLDRIDIFFYQDYTEEVEQGRKSSYVYKIAQDANGNTVYRLKLDENNEPIIETKQQSYILHNFIDEYGHMIPYDETQNGIYSLYPPNIYIDKIDVMLGLTTDECSTDRILLYSYDQLSYGAKVLGSSSRNEDEKELHAAWIHKLNNGDMVLVDHYKKQNINDVKALEYYNAKIHWYHFEYDCVQDITVLAEKQGGVNWKFLSGICDDEQIYNQFTCTVYPDITRAKEKWKVIFEYNSVPYVSDPIVFSNVDTTVETQALDAANEVVFRLLRESINENGDKVIIEDSSLGNFFVYDENNVVIENDENVPWSSLWFYIQVWIRNNDTGTYSPLPMLIDDVWDTSTFDVTWYNPGINSMIENFGTVTDEDLNNAVLCPITDNLNEGLKNAIRECTHKFQIKSTLNVRYLNNTIAATVVRNGRVYHLSKELFFGQSGSMGSEYTVVIAQTLPENGSMVEQEEFAVRAVVYDSKGREVFSPNFIFSWELLSPTIITEGRTDEDIAEDEIGKHIDAELIENNNYNYKTFFSKIKPRNYELTHDFITNYNSIITGYIRNDNPIVLRVTVRGAADYPITATMAFSLTDDSQFNNRCIVNCPSKIEFKSDGKAPITVNTQFEVKTKVQDTDSTLITYEIFPEWYLKQYVLDELNRWNLNDPPGYVGLKKSVVAQQDLNINSNPIVYYVPRQENGITKIDYNYDFSLTQIDDNYVMGNYLSIKNEINNEINSTDNNDDFDAIIQGRDYYINILQNLNTLCKNYIPTHNVYALNQYVDYSPLRNVPWQWNEKLGNNFYTYIGYEEGNIYFKQAIAFTRNVYSSSLINSWDGRLQIDDTNGSVLAHMISAGAKSKDGKFTGVMMGDWADVADNSLDIPGLYGLQYGDQAFGFKTDGTGFIGKTGHGRIEFDGNHSIIRNSTGSCYINLDPVIYDGGLTNNTTDPNSTSQFFLFSKVPKKVQEVIYGVDDIEYEVQWAEPYIKDSYNDFFIVDPNNGVVTSGGIIARYGKIGNWIISSSGLYQKYTSPDGYAANNRYMYLGYPCLPQDYENHLNLIRSTYDGYLDLLGVYKQNELDEFKASQLWDNINSLNKYYKAIFVYDPYHYFNWGWPLKKLADIIHDALISYDAYSISSKCENELQNFTFNVNSLTRENKILYLMLTDADRIRRYITPDDCWRQNHPHFQFKADGTYTIMPAVFGGLTQVYNNVPSRVFMIAQISCRHDNSRVDEFGIAHYGIGPVQVTRLQSTYSGSCEPYMTYYADRDPANRGWNKVWQQYVDTRSLPKAISCRTDVLTKEYLAQAEKWLLGAYQWHYDAYMEQLNEMIIAAIMSGELPATALEELKYQQAQQQQDLIEFIRRLDLKYKDREAYLLERREKEITEYINSTEYERYMIFAGHDTYSSPLFSVNWTGYATMRAGKIGDVSPWYISDSGLTQKNLFGTIFLGNPDINNTPLTQNEYELIRQGKYSFFSDEKMHPLQDLTKGQSLTYSLNQLLNNVGTVYCLPVDTNTPVKLYYNLNDFLIDNPSITENDAITKHRYILRNHAGGTGANDLPWMIINGTSATIKKYGLTVTNNYPLVNDYVLNIDGSVSNTTRLNAITSHYGPLAYNEYGNYAIYAGKDKINFGVRMDGTLFSQRGSIGRWRIEEGQLVNYLYDIPVDSQNVNELIALDATKHQIRLYGSQIVLDGTNGIVFIGAKDYGDNHTNGLIRLASYFIYGRSEGISFQYGMGGKAEEAVNNAATGQIEWEGYVPADGTEIGETYISQGNYINAFNYATHEYNSGNIGVFKGNRLKIYEKREYQYGNECGIYLDTGYTEGNVNSCNAWLYPVSPTPHNGKISIGFLGNWDHRWDLYAGQVLAREMFLVDELDPNWEGEHYVRVATETYVANLTNNIYSSLVRVDTATAECLKIAKRGLAAANTALKSCIKSISITNSDGATAGQYTIYGTATTVGNGSIPIQIGSLYGLGHTHSNTLAKGNPGYIKLTNGVGTLSGSGASSSQGGSANQGNNQGIQIFSANGVKVSPSEGGTITIEVTVADQKSSDSFNIADTKFYKEHAYSGNSIGAYNATTKTYDIDIIAVDGTTLTTITVNAAAAYWAGKFAARTYAETHKSTNCSQDDDGNWSHDCQIDWSDLANA